ncbi:MAG: queuosine precursor transporter [Pseudomonadota bacterium]
MQNELLFFFGCFLITGLVVTCARYAHQHLTLLVVFFGLLANILVQKQVLLFGIHATTTDVFAVGSLLSVNFLQRTQGNAAAKRAVLLTFASFLFFCLVTHWHHMWIPSAEDTASVHYEHILSNMPRFFAASCAAYLVSQYTDIGVFSYVSKRWKAIPIGLAILISLSISEWIDTVIFSYGALWGVMSNITEVLLISYGIKLLAVGAMALSSQLLYRPQ